MDAAPPARRASPAGTFTAPGQNRPGGDSPGELTRRHRDPRGGGGTAETMAITQSQLSRNAESRLVAPIADSERLAAAPTRRVAAHRSAGSGSRSVVPANGPVWCEPQSTSGHAVSSVPLSATGALSVATCGGGQARLPAAGDLSARQSILGLPAVRDSDLHRRRPRPRPDRVLLLVDPPPPLLTGPDPAAQATVCRSTGGRGDPCCLPQSPASSSVAVRPACAVRRRKSARSWSSASLYSAQIWSIEVFIPE